MKNKTKYVFSPYEKKIAVVTRNVWEKMKAIALDMDINNGGLYDARSGAINIWVSPEDHPKDWSFGIIKGALNYPREFLASIYAHFIEDNHVELYIRITNYAKLDWIRHLLEHENMTMKEYRHLSEMAEKGTEEEWRWVEEKAKQLIAQAEAEKDIYEIAYCPFCGREFPELKIFNEFIDHIATHVKIEAIIMSGVGWCIKTEKGILTPQDYTREKISK